MNAVEIEEAVSALVEAPFDQDSFPYSFLEAFGNKPATIKRLKKGGTNKSDVAGGLLQRNNIHLAICDSGTVSATLPALRESQATASGKVKYILATDGETIEAENLVEGETLACSYEDMPDHFGFFLPLAGITTVKQIRENAFDIKATSRLNKLYVELLKENPEWGEADRQHDMNHFMARLVFCYFAEDTDIFREEDLFTGTVDKMSESDASNTHEIIAEIFRAMNTKSDDRDIANIARWARGFPYVNGGLFSGSLEVPKFNKLARSYLVHVGNLDWTKINPDIFGSMIQAVADDDERGELGMHYTSVPNILKVLNPLFLDDLREKLEEAGDNNRKLLNLRNRMSKIRVFDPACGSGNFLVIAYKEMRAIEAVINQRRGEIDSRTDIPLTNFRGIELRDFAAEIARLALIIAEYQCDVLYRGPQNALDAFLPLNNENWITCGNALRVDWLNICPPIGLGVKIRSDDLFESPLDQVEIDFENEGSETYICGNPPYRGSSYQSPSQKEDLKALFADRTSSWKNFDYIAGWFIKASDYVSRSSGQFAFVSTNSICQGQQVPLLWPLIYRSSNRIHFAHSSFKWTNLASHNAGVIVVIIGVGNGEPSNPKIFSQDEEGILSERMVKSINPYIVPGADVIITPERNPSCEKALMVKGNQPSDGGNLCMSRSEKINVLQESPEAASFIKRYSGSADYIRGVIRYCFWIKDSESEAAENIQPIQRRLSLVSEMRKNAKAPTTRPAAKWPHRFIQIQDVAQSSSLVVPRVSSARRQYLPVGLLDDTQIISDSALAIYDCEIWNFSAIASRIHLCWIATVCGKLKTDYRYSNTLGWNTFPIPPLTEKNKFDLAQCAHGILLARESHFPKTIADLYDPDKMPDNLCEAHDRNDEVLERIYIGRRFKNDTERLEKLFELYTKMTEAEKTPAKPRKKAKS